MYLTQLFGTGWQTKQKPAARLAIQSVLTGGTMKLNKDFLGRVSNLLSKFLVIQKQKSKYVVQASDQHTLTIKKINPSTTPQLSPGLFYLH